MGSSKSEPEPVAAVDVAAVAAGPLWLLLLTADDCSASPRPRWRLQGEKMVVVGEVLGDREYMICRSSRIRETAAAMVRGAESIWRIETVGFGDSNNTSHGMQRESKHSI